MKLLLFAAFVAWIIMGGDDEPAARKKPQGEPTKGYTEARCNPYKACTGRIVPE